MWCEKSLQKVSWRISAYLSLTHYCRTQRLPPSGGRGRKFTLQQENAIVQMVIANNSIRLREICNNIITDIGVFANIEKVGTTTIARVLKKHQIRMKQLYTVPFERNSERVKELRYQYVQVRLNTTHTGILFVILHKTVSYAIFVLWYLVYSLISWREPWHLKPVKMNIRSFLWMRLASTWQKHAAVGGTWLEKGRR